MYDSIFFALFNGVYDKPDLQETFIYHYNNQTILGSDGRVFLSHTHLVSQLFYFFLVTTLSSSGLV